MKILITGCLGYIGSKLTQKLLEDKKNIVYGVDNLLWQNSSRSVLTMLQVKNNFHFINSHVLNTLKYYRYLDCVDTIFPLAALVGANLCKQYIYDTYATNEVAITEMLKKVSSSQRIIFPMTNSGYGIGTDKPCTEEDELKPLSDYGKSKCEAEKNIVNHPNSVSLRLATVFGISYRMRLDLLINNYVETIADEGKIGIYEPNARRNYVNIDDVVDTFIDISTTNHTGIFNFGDSKLNSTKLELAKKIFLALQLPENIDIIDGSDGDKRDYLVSNEKIEKAGFVCKADFNRSVKQIFDFCKQTTKEKRKLLRNY